MYDPKIGVYSNIYTYNYTKKTDLSLDLYLPSGVKLSVPTNNPCVAKNYEELPRFFKELKRSIGKRDFRNGYEAGNEISKRNAIYRKIYGFSEFLIIFSN